MASLPRSHRIVARWVPSAGPTGFRLIDRVRSNHGTLTNMDPASDWVASGGKGALDFDGSNDHALIVDPPPVLYTMPFSVSLWASCRTTTAVSQCFGLGNSTDADQLFVIQFRGDLAGDPIQAQMRGDNPLSNTTAVFSGPYVANRFYHIVAVFTSASSRTIFVDGTQGTTDTTAHTVEPMNRLAIGGLVRTSVASFSGLVDDVTIFNTALTANEVREIYCRGRGYGVFPETDFDEGFAAAFKAYWARRQSQLIGGGL